MCRFCPVEKGREALSQGKCHQYDAWKEKGKRTSARGLLQRGPK